MSGVDGWADLTAADRQALAVAAIVGVEALAAEMERLGLAEPESSLGEARWIRHEMMEATEAGRHGKSYDEVVIERIAARVLRAVRFPERMPDVKELADWLAVAYNEDPATMTKEIADEYTAEEMMERARAMHEDLLALWLIEGKPKREDF